MPAENVHSKKGFDFSHTLVVKEDAPFTFGSAVSQTSSHVTAVSAENSNTNPFIFGDAEHSESPKVPKREKSKDAKLHPIPKWLKTDDSKSHEKDAGRYLY